MATLDPGDAMSLLQSIAGATFDSSRLVFQACMEFPNIDDVMLSVRHQYIYKSQSSRQLTLLRYKLPR